MAACLRRGCSKSALRSRKLSRTCTGKTSFTRDIKPSNIIFVGGRPKLADIGLVTDAGDARSIVGTEGYLAPEGPGTPQADIFALGRVLYEATTGLTLSR